MVGLKFLKVKNLIINSSQESAAGQDILISLSFVYNLQCSAGHLIDEVGTIVV